MLGKNGVKIILIQKALRDKNLEHVLALPLGLKEGGIELLFPKKPLSQKKSFYLIWRKGYHENV